MKSGQEVSCGLLIAGGYRSELFDGIEESFDQVSFAIERKITLPFDLAVCLGRDNRSDAADFQPFNEAVGIIPFVADECLRRNLGEKGFSLGDLMGLAFGEAECQRVSQRIDNDVDFSRRTAARASYGVVLPPFFRAPALCW
jgi:hypothetical protein